MEIQKKKKKKKIILVLKNGNSQICHFLIQKAVNFQFSEQF